MPTISRIATTMIPSSSVPERPPELDEPVVFATVYGPVLAGVVVVVLGVVNVGSTVPGVVAPVVLAAARDGISSAASVKATATPSQLLARLPFRARPVIAAI
jgi:hypothetical protein